MSANDHDLLSPSAPSPEVRAASLGDEVARISSVEQLEHQERQIIAITAVGHALCHIGELIFPGVMIAVMRQYQLEPSTATAMVLLGYMLMGFGAIPVGFWADWWGPRRVLFVYFLAMTAGALACALAPNAIGLFVGLTLLGLATSIYHPTGLAMLSLGTRPHVRGQALGINGVAGSVGVALGPLIGLVAASFDVWRVAYLIVAALAAASALWMRRVTIQDSNHQGSVRPDETSSRPPTTGWSVALILLFVIMMLGGFNYRCLVTALPTYLSGTAATGGALAIGGLATSLVLLIGGLGQYSSGRAADRLGAFRVYFILIGCLVPIAVLLTQLEGSPFAYVAAGCFSICLFGQQPVENSILADATSAARRSTSYGTKFALTFGIGALGTQVVGLIWRDLDALGPVFYLIAASAVTMAGLLWLAVRSRRLAEARR
jgi:MFS family permease